MTIMIILCKAKPESADFCQVKFSEWFLPSEICQVIFAITFTEPHEIYIKWKLTCSNLV